MEYTIEKALHELTQWSGMIHFFADSISPSDAPHAIACCMFWWDVLDNTERE